MSLQRERRIQELRDLIDGIDVCMLTTYDGGRQLHSRPLQTQQMDAEGQLWKTIWSHPVVMPDLPATTPQQQWGFNDLISGAWYASGVVNERNQHYKIVPRRPDSYFTPDAMAGDGVR